MCRWLAYTGPEMPLDALLFAPDNSLIRQSLAARRSAVTTNGDGFGLGWYGARAVPGLFRETLPAWNDANLRSLAEQIGAGLFFAHVRASTGTATSRENCHPFRVGRSLFMHNGSIGGWDRVRREMERRIPAALYAHRLGTTDSEAFFLLALAHGLEADPHAALSRAVDETLEVMAAEGVEEGLRMTAAFSDGEKLVALRFATDGPAPSLFHAEGGTAVVKDGKVGFGDGPGAALVLSEPLDETRLSWTAVGDGEVLVARGGDVTVTPLAL